MAEVRQDLVFYATVVGLVIAEVVEWPVAALISIGYFLGRAHSVPPKELDLPLIRSQHGDRTYGAAIDSTIGL
jgi:hypothetical protein